MNTSTGQRVGGRHGIGHPPVGGGGHLDNYTESESRIGAKKNFADPRFTDARLAVLREIGLEPHWYRLAQAIGMDSFLTFWRTLDTDETVESSIFVSIPTFEKYDEFVRHYAASDLFCDYVVDPRLVVLGKIGMKPRWYCLAEVIGMDHFLYIWKFVSDHYTGKGSKPIINMPRISRYLRCARNKLIQDLADKSVPSRDIKKRLHDELGVVITVRRIDQLKLEFGR